MLRPNRYKCSILSGCNTQRRFLEIRFQYVGFVKLLSNTQVFNPLFKVLSKVSICTLSFFLLGEFCNNALPLNHNFWSNFKGCMSDQDTVCQDLTVEDLSRALWEMKLGRSPGYFGCCYCLILLSQPAVCKSYLHTFEPTPSALEDAG